MLDQSAPNTTLYCLYGTGGPRMQGLIATAGTWGPVQRTSPGWGTFAAGRRAKPPSGAGRQSHAPAAQPPHCAGVPTVTRARFHTPDFSDAALDLEFGDGDGPVALPSLAVCDGWAREQAAKVHVRRYPGVEHGTLLWQPGVFGDVLAIVLNTALGPLGGLAAAAEQ